MNNQPVGILDSGVGGLSIWKEIVLQLPSESTIYIADSKNCPYGSKSEPEIYLLAKRLVQFLIKKRCKLIVLACNTITVSCLDKLRKDFPKIPIVGTVPVVKTAVERSKNRRIGILSTKRTAASEYQKNLIQKFASDCEVINIGTDELVPYIERGEICSFKFKEILKKELQPFIVSSHEFRSCHSGEPRSAGPIESQWVHPEGDAILYRLPLQGKRSRVQHDRKCETRTNIDVLALGCSHFPFLKAQMQEILGSKVLLLDSGAAVARQVKRVLSNNNDLSLLAKPRYEFYITGDLVQFKKAGQILIGDEFTGIIREILRYKDTKILREKRNNHLIS